MQGSPTYAVRLALVGRPLKKRHLLVAAFVFLYASPARAEQTSWLDVAPARVLRLLDSAARLAIAKMDGPTNAEIHGPPSVADVYGSTQNGPFDDVILAAARRFKIDPFLLKGLLHSESKLDPIRYGSRQYGEHKGQTIVISGGAIGIAQFTGHGIREVNALREKRAQTSGAVLEMFDHEKALQPYKAIPAAAELLAHLIRRYGRDGGITAYNSGVVGGLAVARYGFWRARHEGKLHRFGVYLIQGYRFLLHVLDHANFYRRQAGLAPLDGPDADRPDSRRYVKASGPAIL
jgi:soluble lytic murein transglycosylase-like protein